MTAPATPGQYLRLLIRHPDQAAHEIVALGVPMRALWIGFWLFSILSAILVALHARAILASSDMSTFPPGFAEMLAVARDSPLGVALGQAILFFLLLQVLDRVGRAMGGQGDFRGALQIIVLVLGVSSALMAGQLLGILMIPILATVLGFGFLVFLVWHVPGLVMGLHGFQSRIAVFAMIVFSFLLIETGLSLVAGLIRAVLT